MKRFNDGRDWFFENRFGMFVHWGIYSLLEWHEQVQWRQSIPKAEYVKLMERFNPTEFDPEAWMVLMKEAGMDYICFTTKHHDGFCMWDTAQTDYNVMNTPYGQDILKELADACARHNIKLCLYYSCPDWHHPNAINQGGDHQLAQQNPGDEPNDDLYIEYVKKQTAELCSNYGRIHALFWDIPPEKHDSSVNELVRKLQPGIMINDRGWSKGDYNTPERHVPDGSAFETPTEACQSVGQQSWGFRAGEDYFSHEFLMRSIAKIMAMEGNYLLNVGPKPDGTIPEEAQNAIRAIGGWYKRVKPALTATGISDLFQTDRFMATSTGESLYIIFHQGCQASGILLDPIDLEPLRAKVLNSGAELRSEVVILPSHWHSKPFLHISGIPVNDLTGEVIVLQLDFESLADDYLEELRTEAKAKAYIY